MPTKRILCVDDDESTCELLVTMLGLSDLEAVSTPDADGVLRMMEREQFGLYTIDCQLPDVSGLTLCRQIRAIDEDTPIVIFSGTHTGRTLMRGCSRAQTPTSSNQTLQTSSPPSNACSKARDATP